MCKEVFESEHPTRDERFPPTDMYQTISFPGAKYIAISFDPQTSLRAGMTLTFYKDESYTSLATAGSRFVYRGSSRQPSWPGVRGAKPLVIPADTCCFHFHTGWQEQDAWGFKFTKL